MKEVNEKWNAWYAAWYAALWDAGHAWPAWRAADKHTKRLRKEQYIVGK